MQHASVPEIGDPAPRTRPLTVVLETFPAVLSKGIERSGMSLEHLQRKLAARGIRVSLSTLSYWRRGRTRPERPESLQAVEVLEEVLDLPKGYLLSLLGPRKPRGRWASRGGQIRAQDSLWEDSEGLVPLLGELDEPAPTELTYLSVHEQHYVDHQRRDSVTKVRGVVRAEVDWLRTLVVLHRGEVTDRALPAIVAAHGCVLGRTRNLPSGRFTVSEIVLDRVLKAGDTATFEYEVRWFGTAWSQRYVRAFRRAVREYLLQINFHPNATPSSVHQFRQQRAGAEEVVAGELGLGSFHSAHMLARESDSAILGIRWHW